MMNNSFEITKMPDLPRIKLLDLGASALTDLELVQIVIGNGCNGYDYSTISHNLLYMINAVGIDRLSLDHIRAVKGIGIAKASAIYCTFELYKRIICQS